MEKKTAVSGQGKSIALIGTLDTKGTEIAFLQSQIQRSGLSATIMDVGIHAQPSCKADISQEKIALRAGADISSLLRKKDGKIHAMEAMARGAELILEEKIEKQNTVGVIALGGGIGTWTGMKVMRSLAFGFPKIMISTLPFDIRTHLGSKDIILFPSVTDILGLNPILRKILENAAWAMAGMVSQKAPPAIDKKKLIAITALGVTTPLVIACKNILEKKGFEIAAFHSVGIGGRTFEEWVASGVFTGILDISTHDINNALFHGISVPPPDRLETAARLNIPQVVVPGGLDFITRGPVEDLSPEERQKQHYRHSPMFTHVRTTGEEMKQVARTVAEKLNQSRGFAVVAVPLQGFSVQGHQEGHLADHAADMVFVATLKEHLKNKIPVIDVDAHINDETFARTICSTLLQLIDRKNLTDSSATFPDDQLSPPSSTP